jgi:hypothetical protein
VAAVVLLRLHAGDFDGCPAEGEGGDPALNRLKNRLEEAAWVPTDFAAIASLDWPKGLEHVPRADWNAAVLDRVAKEERRAVSIEGYLAGARAMGKEPCNCYHDEPDDVDFHVWLTANPGEGPARAIVTEVTPRIRAKHPTWTVDALEALAHARSRLRISGWMMFDPEHPEQLGTLRMTLWEVHPILRIEVQQPEGWQDL